MSIKIMAALWEMDFSPTEKLVFLALADCANDEGIAWPSIATIVRKTGAGERSVQRAIRAGELSGLISREEVAGKGCRYTINPRHSGTPATKSPVPNQTKTPATVAPHPRHSGTQTIIEPSIEPPINIRRAKACKKPDGVSDELWADWLSHRDGKFSATALAGFERESAKVGWTVAEAFTEAIERKWQGFKADWVKEKRNGRKNNQDSEFGGRTVNAAASVIARLGGAGISPDGGGGQTGRYAHGDPPVDTLPSALLAIGNDTRRP